MEKEKNKSLGKNAPKRIQLQSKKSNNFTNNKIDISVFDGKPQKAFIDAIAPKNDMDYMNRKKMQEIE